MRGERLSSQSGYARMAEITKFSRGVVNYTSSLEAMADLWQYKIVSKLGYS